MQSVCMSFTDHMGRISQFQTNIFFLDIPLNMNILCMVGCVTSFNFCFSTRLSCLAELDSTISLCQQGVVMVP